jgi:hypothetical protein
MSAQMSSSLLEVWNAAAGSPFYPAVGKNSQFFFGFTLLIAGTLPHCIPGAFL